MRVNWRKYWGPHWVTVSSARDGEVLVGGGHLPLISTNQDCLTVDGRPPTCVHVVTLA